MTTDYQPRWRLPTSQWHKTAAAGLAVLLFYSACASDQFSSAEFLATPQSLPEDVRDEIQTVRAGALLAFGMQQDCMTGATLVLVDDVADGDGRYLIDDAKIEIQIPTSPRRFRETLAHELAHHMEHNCDGVKTMRESLLSAIGRSGHGWNAGSVWEDRPAEMYAEAVVLLVTGDRLRSDLDMPLPAAMVEVVEQWGADDVR